MKVQDSKGVSPSSKTKKPSATADSDVDFSLFMGSEAPESSAARATQTIARVDVLLTVQGVDNPAERSARKQARARAGAVLGELEKIRIALLGGNLTIGHMIDVADVVASHRENVTDPTLTAIMDEIDLRAQVELAKMRVVLDGGRTQAISR
jgi:hypothetical protein